MVVVEDGATVVVGAVVVVAGVVTSSQIREPGSSSLPAAGLCPTTVSGRAVAEPSRGGRSLARSSCAARR